MLSIALALALSAAQQQAIVRYFDADLIDGQSARWKWPAQRDKKRLYCGWVNAKNRVGAYAGWAPFYVMFEDAGTISRGSIVELGEKDIAYETICGANGYDIHSPPRD